jgi:hypothetical protein
MSNLLPSLESHAAVLAAEISELNTDLEHLNILKRKYGPETFAHGDAKLKEVMLDKQSKLEQVRKPLQANPWRPHVQS